MLLSRTESCSSFIERLFRCCFDFAVASTGMTRKGNSSAGTLSTLKQLFTSFFAASGDEGSVHVLSRDAFHDALLFSHGIACANTMKRRSAAANYEYKAAHPAQQRKLVEADFGEPDVILA